MGKLVIVLGSVLLASPVLAQTETANHIEAVVNDKIVTRWDVMEEFRKAKVPFEEMSETEKEIEYEKMLLNLVLDHLHDRAVKAAGVQISEEDLRNVQQAERERLGFATREAFVDFLQSQGQTEDEYNRQFRRDQETAAWLKVLSGSGAGGVKKLSRELRPRYNIAVAPREIREYYLEHKTDKFTLKEEAEVRVIKVYFNDRKHADKQRKKQLLLGLKQKLATKADFAVLAAKNSDHPSKDKGGKIGTVEKGKGDTLPVPIEEAIFADDVEAGDVVGPVEHVNSWWLVQVEARQSARVVPFAEAQREIQGLLRFEKQNRAIRIIQLELVREAHITPARLKRRIIAKLGG